MPRGYHDKILRVDLTTGKVEVEQPGAPVGGGGRSAVGARMYYEMRGWDEGTGSPTAGKLYELGVGWVAELLYRD